MAALTRKFKKIFAKDASNNGVFGSAAAADPEYSNDPETIESLPAFLDGWNDATVAGLKLPTLPDMQGLKYDTDYHLAYMYQAGIAEYNNQTEYTITSIVRESGTTKIYKSLATLNTGNPLSDGTKWSLLGDLVNLPTSTPLLASNNLSDVASPSTSRANLGLGNVSTYNTGTSGATVPLNSSLGSAAYLTAGSASGNLPIIGTSGYLLKSIQIFTSSGTWTKPSNINAIYVIAVGGGAGGKDGGGGGAGGYSKGFITSGFGASQTVTIGAGGAASTNGGNTSFGSLITATGGSVGGTITATGAGSSYYGGNGGFGGGTAAQQTGNGGAGGGGIFASIAGNAVLFAGSGGSSILGGGGNGLGSPGGGAGAGGGGNHAGTPGAGISGAVIVYEYI